MGDVSEEIDSIIWNVYGKIERVVRTSTSSKSDLEFRYDAMGNRICKIVKPRAGAGVLSQDNWTYTYYLRDASGNVIAVYDRDFEQQPSDATFTDELSVKEQHLYGSSRVGIRSVDEVVATITYNYSSTASNGTLVGTYAGMNSVAASTTNWSHTLKQKAYELSNHLGNVLVTVSDARTANNSGGTIASYTAIVLSAQDYYAFGSSMVGRSVSGDYRYSFNGKETDAETDLQDYGFRIYNPELGKFLSEDPLAARYAYYSPYHFAGNSPVACIDIDGAESDYVPEKFTGSGNVMIILMDNPTAQLHPVIQAALAQSGWDYVCVNTLEEADAWLHAHYADGSVNNMIIQTHGTCSGYNCETQTCNDPASDGSAICARTAEGDVKNKCDIIPVLAADFQTVNNQTANPTAPAVEGSSESGIQNARAIQSMSSVLAQGASVLYMGCGLGRYEDLNQAIYTTMNGEQKGLTMYFSIGTTEFAEGGAVFFNDPLANEFGVLGWNKLGKCLVYEDTVCEDVYDMIVLPEGIIKEVQPQPEKPQE